METLEKWHWYENMQACVLARPPPWTRALQAGNAHDTSRGLACTLSGLLEAGPTPVLVKHVARAQGRRRGSLLLPDLRSQGDRGRASKGQAQRIPGENAPPLTLGNTAGASVTTGPAGAGEGRAHPRACHPNGVEARGPSLSVTYRLAQGSPEPALKPQVRGHNRCLFSGPVSKLWTGESCHQETHRRLFILGFAAE